MKETALTNALLTSDLSTQVIPRKRTNSQENSVWYMGNLLTFLAEGRHTEGRFALMELQAKPGSEPPPHIHEREDEVLYILDGYIEAFVDSKACACLVGPGECIFLPRNRPHTFRIRSERLRMLILVQPAWLDGYFRALSEPAAQLTVPDGAQTYSKTIDMARIHSVANEYGLRFLSQEEIASQLPVFERRSTNA